MTYKEREAAFRFAADHKGKFKSVRSGKIVEVLGVTPAGGQIMWASFTLKHESGRTTHKAAHYFVEEYRPMNLTPSGEVE